ncbi:MAG: MBOAT family O-acyltransferase, partial [Gemmiger sp.]
MFSVTSLGFPLFLAVLVLVWYRLPAKKRWWAMLAFGMVFYLTLDAGGFLLLLIASGAVWQCAKRGWFRLGIAASLLPLLALKYSGMVLPSLRGLWQPIGLSYFSLQLAGYLLDVRAGRIKAETDYRRVLCYAGFFLSITQGPLNHYDQLMPQLERDIRFDAERLWNGAARMAWGYFKKYAVAERAAVVVNEAFLHPEKLDTSQLLFGVVLFAFQLYADFSGYTDVVLGAGECLGLALPENFRQPYMAGTIGEFWNRWHISLSGWLQEYVFEPLSWGDWAGHLPLIGRFYTKPPMLTSLMITFAISGLWHGAAWNFLVWGALNGFFQVVSAWTRRFRKRVWKRTGISAKHPLRRWWQRWVVFTCVCFGYVFFRAATVGDAL